MAAISGTKAVVFTCVGALVIAGVGFGAKWLLSSSPPAPAEERRWVEVKQVRSGDTVTVDPDDKLLYVGIRAPLLDEPLFEASKERNRELVEGQRLRLRFDEQERDKKGRLLGYAFVDGVFVNETLVREGLAFVRLTPGAQRFAQQLLAAQAEARKATRGIWRTPMKFTAGRFVADPKYGNFHTDTCEELNKKDPQRLIEFASLDAAFDAGFAPCPKCKPCSWSD
jgi:micrococcal nuclease